ncbi:MAG: M28 family peptidase [Acidobacteria bacterium]|nr:M28 family peptidase [Acidobacteriota bacterium]
MKKQLFSFLLIISFVFSVSSQKAQQAKFDTVEENLRTHVAYLASDKLEGRRTGETGATFAAGYVANMFANYKLKPGFKENSNGKAKANFLQAFPFISGVKLGQDNFLRIIPEDSTKENKMEVTINWMPVGFSTNGYIPPAPLVFVGYGVDSRELNYNNYSGLDVKGKIVFAFDGTPDDANPHSQFASFNLHAKAKIAKEKGAKALVLIARESDFKEDKLAQLKYDQTLGETALPTIVIMRSHGADLLGAKDETELAEIEKWIANPKEMPESVRLKLANLPKAVAQIKVNLTKKQTAEAYNVIGILEGSDPILRNEAIVIGAHYDHLGHGGRGSLAANSTQIHHGADDNACLKDEKLTIGGIGTASEWRAMIATNQPVNIGKLEMANGSKTDAPIVVGINGQTMMTKQPDIPTFNLQLNEDGFGPSDHSSFYSKQIPVLFFFTGTHTDYHKPSDTAEKINYEGLLKITNFVADLVRAVDQNPKKPTYVIAKSSGIMGGRTGFNVSLGTIPSYSESNNGLILDGVRENSPAAKVGLKAGDKITKLAGKEIRNVSDYTFVLGEMKADVEYGIEILRGAEKLMLKIVPAARK